MNVSFSVCSDLKMRSFHHEYFEVAGQLVELWLGYFVTLCLRDMWHPGV